MASCTCSSVFQVSTRMGTTFWPSHNKDPKTVYDLTDKTKKSSRCKLEINYSMIAQVLESAPQLMTPYTAFSFKRWKICKLRGWKFGLQQFSSVIFQVPTLTKSPSLTNEEYVWYSQKILNLKEIGGVSDVIAHPALCGDTDLILVDGSIFLRPLDSLVPIHSSDSLLPLLQLSL